MAIAPPLPQQHGRTTDAAAAAASAAANEAGRRSGPLLMSGGRNCVANTNGIFLWGKQQRYGGRERRRRYEAVEATLHHRDTQRVVERYFRQIFACFCDISIWIYPRKSKTTE